jgi:hypothetical protein
MRNPTLWKTSCRFTDPLPISSPEHAERFALADSLTYWKKESGRHARPKRKPGGGSPMCRNIKILFNFEPPVTPEEIRAASLQYVRKITGFNKPSQSNEAAFQAAVEEISAASSRLLHALATNAPPKNREEEAAKAKARAAVRFSA